MAEMEPRAEATTQGADTRPPSFDGPGCDACGTNMQPMGHCKYLCRQCGFLRTCMDTV